MAQMFLKFSERTYCPQLKLNTYSYSMEPMTNETSILTLNVVRTDDRITVKVNCAGLYALQFESRVGV